MKEQTKTFFKTVMKSGGLFNSGHLSVKAVKGKSPKSEARVIVSKKVVPSAVARNLLRRRIRGLFKELKPQSVQAVFYAKKGVQGVSLKELRKEVNYLIEKL